ncbi:MAG: DUF4276 family protein [Proteobacteria bacterium]|nr:DUF4276 family protein [Pseudomonadota bacterium]
MKKLAVFLEGQTERLFVESLIQYSARNSRVQIQSKRGNLGRKHQRIFFEVSAKNIGTGNDFYILVIDSGSDNNVISDIKELYQNLVKQDFSLVVGFRDVRPDFSRREISKLRRGLYSSIPAVPKLPVEFRLAIMEVEAWFLAENTHFKRFDRRLTRAKIEAELGFFPDDNISETRDFPSDDLDRIHKTIGKRYDKSYAVVSNVISSLNYQNLVDLHSLKITDLGGLVRDLTDFLQADV